MDTLKEPAIVGCIILTVIIICLAIFFYRQIVVLESKVTNLENVLSTNIKEMGDFREHKKAIPWLNQSLKEHGGTINNLSENMSTMIKEIKYLKRCLGIITDELNSKNIIDVNFPKSKKKITKKKRRTKKKEVSFDTDSSESSSSESESDDSSESEDDVSDIRKRLDKMKKKKKRN